MANPWTKKEVATLRAIVKSEFKLKESMHRLPGRTYGAAMWKSGHLGVRAPTTAAQIRELMSDGKERTAREIANALKCDRKRVSDTLRLAIEPGPGQEMHAVRIHENGRMRVFVAGPGPNVISPLSPKPVPDDLSDDDLDRKYRASAAWWPRADPVLLASMNAMMHAGQASA